MGLTIHCKDNGPLVEWGDSSTGTDVADGAGTDFDGGFVDVNTCKLEDVLDSIADFLKRIFGGGDDDDGDGGGETDGGGDDSGLVIDVSGTTLTYMKVYRPLVSASQSFVIPYGTYPRVGEAIQLPIRRLRRPSPTATALNAPPSANS